MSKDKSTPTSAPATRAKDLTRELKERATTYTTTWAHPLTQATHKLTIKHTRATIWAKGRITSKSTAANHARLIRSRKPATAPSSSPRPTLSMPAVPSPLSMA